MKTEHGCALALAVLVGCAIPGQLYTVSPAIEGRVTEGGRVSAEGEVTLTVRHRENPRLDHRMRVPVDPQGRFSFPQVELAVAGQEFDKRYELFLHLTRDDDRAAIWKVEYSRLELGEPVRLDCDLDRSPTRGMPCRVSGKSRAHGWIVDAGSREFRRYCASCHGRDGRGQGPAAAALQTPPADLTGLALRNGGVFPTANVALWVDGRLVRAHGTSEMPVWGTRLAEEYVPGPFAGALARGRIDSIVTYLETIQRSD